MLGLVMASSIILSQGQLDNINANSRDMNIVGERDSRGNPITRDNCTLDYCWYYFNKTVLQPELDYEFNGIEYSSYENGNYIEVVEEARVKWLHSEDEIDLQNKLNAYEQVERERLKNKQTKPIITR